MRGDPASAGDSIHIAGWHQSSLAHLLDASTRLIARHHAFDAGCDVESLAIAFLTKFATGFSVNALELGQNRLNPAQRHVSRAHRPLRIAG
jgi:hypothetical protein